jgi:hypothetical protein
LQRYNAVAIMPFYLEIMLANVSIPGLSVFRVVGRCTSNQVDP